MKIIYKEKGDMCDAIFFPQTKGIKKVLFSRSTADHRGRRSVRLKAVFTAVCAPYVLERPRLSRSFT